MGMGQSTTLDPILQTEPALYIYLQCELTVGFPILEGSYFDLGKWEPEIFSKKTCREKIGVENSPETSLSSIMSYELSVFLPFSNFFFCR